MPDAFESWISKQEPDAMIELADKYGDYRSHITSRTIERFVSHGETPAKNLKQDFEAWVWEYFAEHVYPFMNDGDAQYDAWKDD
jgi:hypothetical protein